MLVRNVDIAIAIFTVKLFSMNHDVMLTSLARVGGHVDGRLGGRYYPRSDVTAGRRPGCVPPNVPTW